jgi:hypothetical protein
MMEMGKTTEMLEPEKFLNVGRVKMHDVGRGYPGLASFP